MLSREGGGNQLPELPRLMWELRAGQPAGCSPHTRGPGRPVPARPSWVIFHPWLPGELYQLARANPQALAARSPPSPADCRLLPLCAPRSPSSCLWSRPGGTGALPLSSNETDSAGHRAVHRALFPLTCHSQPRWRSLLQPLAEGDRPSPEWPWPILGGGRARVLPQEEIISWSLSVISPQAAPAVPIRPWSRADSRLAFGNGLQ